MKEEKAFIWHLSVAVLLRGWRWKGRFFFFISERGKAEELGDCKRWQRGTEMQISGNMSVTAHAVTPSKKKKRQKVFRSKGFIFGIQYQGKRGKYNLN